MTINFKFHLYAYWQTLRNVRVYWDPSGIVMVIEGENQRTKALDFQHTKKNYSLYMIWKNIKPNSSMLSIVSQY